MNSVREDVGKRYNDVVTLKELVDYTADIVADSMWWFDKDDTRYEECINQFEALIEAISRIFEIYGESLDELTNSITDDKACDIYEQRYGTY